jgi:hypothetical protein
MHKIMRQLYGNGKEMTHRRFAADFRCHLFPQRHLLSSNGVVKLFTGKNHTENCIVKYDKNHKAFANAIHCFYGSDLCQLENKRPH